MLNLNGVTKITTDIEILDSYAKHFQHIYRSESYEDIITALIKDFENPFKVLSIVTGHDEDFIIGYIRTYLKTRK